MKKNNKHGGARRRATMARKVVKKRGMGLTEITESRWDIGLAGKYPRESRWEDIGLAGEYPREPLNKS